ncbi:hypothetical protein MMC12_000457 [Toensbergia leucococca]|nr:hypothetical protein [Toensbergia leucococca]
MAKPEEDRSCMKWVTASGDFQRGAEKAPEKVALRDMLGMFRWVYETGRGPIHSDQGGIKFRQDGTRRQFNTTVGFFRYGYGPVFPIEGRVRDLKGNGDHYTFTLQSPGQDIEATAYWTRQPGERGYEHATLSHHKLLCVRFDRPRRTSSGESSTIELFGCLQTAKKAATTGKGYLIEEDDHIAYGEEKPDPNVWWELGVGMAKNDQDWEDWLLKKGNQLGTWKKNPVCVELPRN